MASIIDSNAPAFAVGVALNGTGWHPASWCEAGSNATGVFTAAYWQSIIRELEESGIDFVTLEDSLTLQSADTVGTNPHVPAVPDAGVLQGRLDALLIANWVAANVPNIGIIPTVTVTHTEPFHIATALQTLDHISEGRAGAQVKISSGAQEAAAFGRRPTPTVSRDSVLAGRTNAALDALLDEAGDAVEVARRLWDSWEDDAIIRDEHTSRFLDRNKVHHIHFTGQHFNVVGPSIVPRSPQGQIPVTLLAHTWPVYQLAAHSADVVFITPENNAVSAGASRGKSLSTVLQEVQQAEADANRSALGLDPLRVHVDAVIAFDTETETGDARLNRLNSALEHHSAGVIFSSDAAVLTGSAESIAQTLLSWRSQGIDGVRLRPLSNAQDLEILQRDLLPRLGISPASSSHASAHPSLRERLNLSEAHNRYSDDSHPKAGTAA